MLTNFQKDLAKAKQAEELVAQLLRAQGYTIEDVSNERKYYSIGDLKIILPSGEERFIEVKNDSRIHETYNILCEEENYFKNECYYSKGNMYSDYDIYCVVSQPARKIYFIDFSVLRRIYKQGTFKVIPHTQQDSYCYLLELYQLKKNGGILGVLNY